MIGRRILVTTITLIPLLVASLWTTAGPVLAAPCDGSSSALQNGGFEIPGVPAGTFQLLPAASVPPWLTTDSMNQIEIWGTGFLGVPAPEGANFTELNANTAATIYQDVVTNPGDTITWTLLHRARSGIDTMQVLSGDAAVANPTNNVGWNYFSGIISDTTAAWGSHTDAFVVPVGQVCTRLALPRDQHGLGQPLHRELPRCDQHLGDARSNANSDADPHPDAYADANANANRHAQRDSDGHANGDRDADSYGHADPSRDSYPVRERRPRRGRDASQHDDDPADRPTARRAADGRLRSRGPARSGRRRMARRPGGAPTALSSPRRPSQAGRSISCPSA